MEIGITWLGTPFTPFFVWEGPVTRTNVRWPAVSNEAVHSNGHLIVLD